MADFYQNGVVTTLHNMVARDIDDLERELLSFSSSRPMGLILPSLFSELGTPALANIVDQLRHVPYLSQVVIGLDRADVNEYRHALNFFSRLSQQHRVLWNDGPRLRALHEELAALNLAPTERGKGCNVWYCMGYILATEQTQAVALHDCDIRTYQRDLLARLIYPVANPAFSYTFCKGFYARIADQKFNGRVCRLLVSPLLDALRITVGENDYLRYMSSFRYALAGEFSFRREVLFDLRIPGDWGLEIGILSEMHRNYSLNRICQVDIADTYDHKHQPVSENDDSQGLSKMSIDIAKAFFRKLATQGVSMSPETFRTIKATYLRRALDYVEAYKNDAAINQLDFDIHEEERAVELFSENIMKAGDVFLERPMETPFIPSWSRVCSAVPDILPRLKEAVELDHDDYSS